MPKRLPPAPDVNATIPEPLGTVTSRVEPDRSTVIASFDPAITVPLG